MACLYQIVNPVGLAPDAYPISSGYGNRVHPVTGNVKFHSGIDIAAPRGTFVRAAFGGTVVYVGNSETAGKWVKLTHPNGLRTKYMHLNSTLVESGDVVGPGDVIGTVGSTGTATGNHLHFQMENENGTSMDPTDCYDVAVHREQYKARPAAAPSPFKINAPQIILGGISILLLIGFIRKN